VSYLARSRTFFFITSGTAHTTCLSFLSGKAFAMTFYYSPQKILTGKNLFLSEIFNLIQRVYVKIERWYTVSRRIQGARRQRRYDKSNTRQSQLRHRSMGEVSALRASVCNAPIRLNSRYLIQTGDFILYFLY